MSFAISSLPRPLSQQVLQAGLSSAVSVGLALAAILASLSPAQSQLLWTQTSITGPGSQLPHAMTYDSQRGVTILFGGSNSSGQSPGIWEWDGSSWSQVATTGPSPSCGVAMAYDSQRRVTVLYDGCQKTWEWNGLSWTLAATVGPGPSWGNLSGAGMAYDSRRGRTVLFGGTDGLSEYGDTWEWDGSSWAHVATTGPSARFDAGMAYDSQRGRIVMFGGGPVQLGGLFLPSPRPVPSDTREWDGSSWTQVATSGPSPRCGLAMVYDNHRGCVVMFGGIALGDTWEWDGSSWTQVATTGPSPRAGHGMAFDSRRGRTVLFGGYGGLSDTWEFGSLSAAASTFGAGCGNPALDLSPVVSARPILNTTAQASLSNIPSSTAFMSLGLSNTASVLGPLPLSLSGFGLTGCDLLQSANAPTEVVTFNAPGSAVYGLALPNNPGLLGVRVYLQGWALAPGVNPAGVVVSNGLEWLVGSS